MDSEDTGRGNFTLFKHITAEVGEVFEFARFNVKLWDALNILRPAAKNMIRHYGADDPDAPLI